MALDTAKRKQVIYFTGTEIENTIAKGWQTLFVVGTRPVDEIAKLATQHNIQDLHPIWPMIDHNLLFHNLINQNIELRQKDLIFQLLY